MGKRNSAAVLLLDRHQTIVRVRPLSGLNRLVKLQHRQRNGILYCDNVMGISHALTFSDANKRLPRCTIGFVATMGALSEPRLNVPNEATEADLNRCRDSGSEIVFSFTPKRGKTYSIEYDMYKAFDAGHRYAWFSAADGTRVAKWDLTLDLSAYLSASVSIVRPRCDYELGETMDDGTVITRGRARRLPRSDKGKGLWGWHVDNVSGGIVGMAWELKRSAEPHASESVILEKLAAELNLDPRLTKDLHNFVMICHYYVVGFRSMSKIGPEMMTSKSALKWSLETLERAIGVELIQRTKGKGLIQITLAGEAVLDWWSQFYMRWTPILAQTGKLVDDPIAARVASKKGSAH